MIDVSTNWKRALGCYNYPNRKPFVPLNDVKIEYEQIDADAQNSGTVSVTDEAPWSTKDDVMDLSIEYDSQTKIATMEANAWGLGGDYSVLEGNPHIGWVSASISGEDFTYEVGNEPCLTITWDEVQLVKIPCIIVTWSTRLGEFARDFTVNCYNGTDLLWTKTVTDNKDIASQVDHELEGYDKIEIIVSKWCLPYTRARIQTVSMGLVVSIQKRDLFSVDLDSNSDLLAFELPDTTLAFEIDNVSEEWNPDKPKGRYAYLLERQKVSMYVAYKLGADTYEWHKIATAFMAEWSTPQNGISATFTARDLMSFMTQKFVPSAIEGYNFGDTISLYDLAQNAFEQADLPIDADGSIKWSIDESLADFNVVIPYSEQTVEGQTVYQYQFEHTNAEVIQLCASASNTAIHIDENGNINVKPVTNTQSDYMIDRFVAFANAEYENQKLLKTVLINDEWSVDVPNILEGELQSISNELIQSQSQALMVASRISTILGKRKVGEEYTNASTLNGEYRADVRLQPLDMIINKNKYAMNLVYVTGVKYSYQGAFRGTYQGRVMRSIPNDDLDYIYYAGDMYANGEL